MSLEEFPKSNWTAFLKENGNPLQLTDKDRDSLIKELVEQCVALLNEGRTDKAIDRISLGLVLNKPAFLTKVKKAGAIRHSRYLNQKDPVSGIARHCLDNRQLFGLSDEDIFYFESLINLQPCADGMRKDQRFISNTILRYRDRRIKIFADRRVTTSIVKALLAINDYSFLTRPDVDPSLIEDINELQFTLEDRSDAISYLISQADELIGIRKEDLVFLDDGFAFSQECENLISAACRYKAFLEAEIQVESAGFVCLKSGGRSVITYPDERTLRSMDMSHIISHQQKQADSQLLKKAFQHLPSIKEMASEIHKEFPRVVTLQTEPYARFRFEIPQLFIAAILTSDIGSFSEDYEALDYVQNELSISLDDLGRYEIVSGLTFRDFMLINRTFTVVQEIYSEKLKNVTTDENKTIILNSILALFRESELLAIFEGNMPPDVVKKYLQVTSWQADGQQYLDLQYTPIVQVEDRYLLSLSVMRHSIMVRNIIASTEKRKTGNRAGQMSFVQQVPGLLKQAFENQGFYCFTDQKIYFKGEGQKEGDIDFLAFKDGRLFIAECKNVLDSVDHFEYRRINDYLLKAASQLDYIKSAVADEGYRRDLGRRLGVDISKMEVHYLIVPTARKMYGHHVGGYPVRYLHELVGFLNEGIWNIRLPGGTMHTFSLWQADQFEIPDLLRYCSAGSAHDEFLKSMFYFERLIGNRTYEAKYALDIQAAFDNMKAAYRFTEHPTPNHSDANR